MNHKRPKHLALMQIRLPLPGILSILHRLSGVLMFLLLPAILYLLQTSLASPEAFARYHQCLSHDLSKLIMLGLVWAYAHHFCAGIRYLLLDVHCGTELKSARTSSYIVFAVSLAVTAFVGVQLW